MMDDKEIEELVQSINDGKDVTNNSIFRRLWLHLTKE